MNEKIKGIFKEKFGENGTLYASAGRINLIGEHTDYNGGYVFPGAIDKVIMAEIRPNGTDKVRVFSIDINEYAEFGLKEEDAPTQQWARYIFGICREIQKRGGVVKGFDAVFAGNVPLGAGLSSSAALESCFAFALNDLFNGNTIDKFELAKIGQSTEHNYCGVNCGIMDQYASACGKAGHAMLLDCATLACEYVPIDTGDCSLVIIDCKKPHSLVESKYNERRAETETALCLLQKKLNINSLAELDGRSLEECGSLLPHNVYNRARHVVDECARVADAAKAMKSGDMVRLGALLNASHASLKDLYEVTGKELDALAAAAQSHPACLGSRMTGGGFGGCTVSLVRTSGVEDFKAHVLEKYFEATGYTAAVYQTQIGDGITVEKI